MDQSSKAIQSPPGGIDASRWPPFRHRIARKVPDDPITWTTETPGSPSNEAPRRLCMQRNGRSPLFSHLRRRFKRRGGENARRAASIPWGLDRYGGTEARKAFRSPTSPRAGSGVKRRSSPRFSPWPRSSTMIRRNSAIPSPLTATRPSMSRSIGQISSDISSEMSEVAWLYDILRGRLCQRVRPEPGRPVQSELRAHDRHGHVERV